MGKNVTKIIIHSVSYLQQQRQRHLSFGSGGIRKQGEGLAAEKLYELIIIFRMW